MPIYKIRDDSNGQIHQVEMDSPPTADDVEEIFAHPAAQKAASLEPTPPSRIETQNRDFLENVSEPTLLGNVFKANPGTFADAYLGAPERTGRVIGGMAGNIAKDVNDVAGGVLGLAGRGINALTGGVAGRGLQKVAEPVANTLGTIENRIDQSEPGRAYSKALENPALAADVKGVQGGIEAVNTFGGIGIGAPIARKTGGKLIEGAQNKLFKPLNEGLGEIAENRTAIPEETLRMAGTKEGRLTLKANKGAAYDIGQELVDNVYNPIDKLPEAANIKAIIPKLPPIVPDKIIGALSKKIVKNPAPEFEAVNQKIAGTIDWINRTAENNGGVLNAQDLVDVRRQMDDLIGDSFGKESGVYVTALKNARHEVRNGLIDAAQASGNSEYITQMASLAKKLDLLDRIKDRLGSSSVVGENRAESFVRNLMSKGKENQREVLNDFDQVFGTDILKRANAAHLAESLGKSGNIPLLSKWNTGAGGNIFERATVGSPAIMSKVLGLTEKLAGSPRSKLGQLKNLLVVGDVSKGIERSNVARPGAIASPVEPYPLGKLLTPEQYRAKKATDLAGQKRSLAEETMAQGDNEPPMLFEHAPDELLTREALISRNKIIMPEAKYDKWINNFGTPDEIENWNMRHAGDVSRGYMKILSKDMPEISQWLGKRRINEKDAEKLLESSDENELNMLFKSHGIEPDREGRYYANDLVEVNNNMLGKKKGGFLGNRRGAVGTVNPQVHTPEFKQWFGDWDKAPEAASKVVDESGKPLEVFHGTSSNFNVVNPKKGAQGLFWFTSDPATIKAGTSGAQGTKNIMPLYANIKNPAGWPEYEKYGLGQLEQMGYDGVILKNKDGSFDGFVFKGNQVKSSVKNNGSFSKATNDIRGNTGLKLLAGTSAAGLGALTGIGALQGRKK